MSVHINDFYPAPHIDDFYPKKASDELLGMRFEHGWWCGAGFELALCVRAHNVLARTGWTVRELTQKTPKDLLRLKLCGPVTVANIRRALAEHGLGLAE